MYRSVFLFLSIIIAVESARAVEHRESLSAKENRGESNIQALFKRPPEILMLVAKSDDAAWCREKCSFEQLPTDDFGFSFWNCYNRCMGINICP